MTRLTNQECYEKIRAHFSAKGAEYGYDEYECNCVYRGSDGQKCAVGCLITDELYDRSFENFNLKGLSEPDTKVDELKREDLFEYLPLDISFLNVVQQTHDDCALSGKTIHTFIKRLDNLARANHLKVIA